MSSFMENKDSLSGVTQMNVLYLCTILDANNMGNFIELVRFRAKNDHVLLMY